MENADGWENVVFKAPDDFPGDEHSSSYTVHAVLEYMVNGSNSNGDFVMKRDTSEVPIKITRAPLALIHGLASSPETWEKFAGYLTNAENAINMYDDYQVLCVDYSDTHFRHFATNENVVNNSIQQLIAKYMSKGIVANKADLIGHSMGGILARWHVQYVPKGNTNVHKIITVNTPHSGSPVANFMNELSQTSALNILKDVITGNMLHGGYDGAIQDLAIGSEATDYYLNDSYKENSEILAKMNNIPIHAVTSYIEGKVQDAYYAAIALGTNEAIEDFLTIYDAFVNPVEAWELPKASYDLFKAITEVGGELDYGIALADALAPGDCIVPYESQTGGLPLGCVQPFSGGLEICHTAMTGNHEVWEHLITMLNASVMDSRFCKTGFHPTKLEFMKRDMSRRLGDEAEPQITQDVSLDIQLSINEGELHVRVDDLKGGSMNNLKVLVRFDGYDELKAGNDFILSIPSTHQGVIKVYACCETFVGESVCDSAFIDVQKSQTSPVELKCIRLCQIDMSTPLAVTLVCTWADGSVTHVIPDAATFTDNLATYSNGKITGLHSGSGTATFTYQGLTCEAPFTVYNFGQSDDEEGSTSVCSTVSLKLSQTMTMTRQAFRGTLTVFNGNESAAMRDVKLDLKVTNSVTGEVATSHEFQINAESLDGFNGELALDAGWTLAGNATGTATILFIPTKYAAPTEPVEWSFGGTFSYIDPFTGTEVTRELYPVTLTVKPSPELDLTYFMQRDVYGDDPLTLDVVEAMEPAEFALLVNNKGYGDATNVKMLTQQPEITENEKGLLIDFELISSQVNGSDATLSFGQSIANDFGTIPAHSQLYAQWWLTSTLLGHFTEYDVQATHVTSYGNPDLSLLDQVTIHELIHGFDMPNGSLIGGPEKGRAFLVNDIVDANDLPDKLYFTNGDTAGVVIATTAKIERTSPTTCLLTVTPSAPGWNYGNLLDPTYGYAELKSIVRQSDGQELGNTRFWQTDRTLRDGKDWLYEYRLHFVDEFNTGAPVTYLLTFDPVPEEVLEVASIGVVPEEGKIAEEPIETLTVTFNKPVDASTFTSDDITLAVQGAKQDVSTIGISTNDNKSFVLDMKTVNPQLGNGYYTLTVQTAGITDWEGFQGRAGKQVGWIMFRGGLVQLLTSAWPKNAGSVMRKPDEAAGSRRLAQTNEDINDNTAEYGSTVTLVAVAEGGYEFTNWTLNGEVVSTDVELETTALGDMNVVANFAKKKYMVNVTVEGTGGTTAGTATGIYEYETEISVTAVPDEDFDLENWTVNGKAVEGSGNMLTVTVDKPLDVQASFLQEYFYQRVTLDKGWNWISAYLSEPWAVTDWSRYTNRIMGQTDEAVNDPEMGMTGSLSELMSGQAYKVEANSRFTNTLRGHLYNTAVSPINLRKGWNWVAFPYMNGATMDVVTTAEEGDFIASQKGFAEYVDGAWTGTLDMFIPGEGYLYKSTSEKSLAFDKSKLIDDSSYGETDADITEQDVDIRRYPSTMNMTARICRDESEELGEGYSIYAMVGDELRGVSQHVSGKHYLTVYGDEAADVTFFVESAETGETFEAHETLAFRDDVVGSSKSPFTINIGEVTGIDSISSDGKMTIYTVEGVLVSQEATMKTLLSLPKGVYIINGKKRFIR